MPTEQTAILFPMLAMAGLAFVVAGCMFVQRVGEMRRRRIHPQSMATSLARSQRLEATTGADNFANLFELPVLFHVLCLALLATGTVSDGYVSAAWAFVGLRVLHSVVHLTYNKVMHRFLAYLAALLVLAGMWVAFALQVLGGG